MAPAPFLKLKVQLYCGAEIAMGPGKADLLDAIAAHGSISAAGRALGMSYRRAWQLVDTMNRCWADPLVETAPGVTHGGGARLTDAGAQVLRCYRALQAALDREGESSDAAATLGSALRTAPRINQKVSRE